MTGNGPPIPHVARFPADAAAPANAIAATRAFAGAESLAAADAARLAIIAEELVCNVVDHGEARAGSEIVLELMLGDGAVRLVLTDAGAPFDPGIAPADADMPDRGGGAGLSIVRRWARIESYERVFGTNRLALAIAVAPATG